MRERKADARQAVLHSHERLDDITHQLVLPDPSSRTEQVPSDLEVIPRRLERRRLARFQTGEVVDASELVPLWGRREDVDAVIELLNEVEDALVKVDFGDGRDETLTDLVVHEAPG